MQVLRRANGLVYVAGENSVPSAPSHLPSRLPNRLPDNVDLVKQLVDPALVSRLAEAAGKVSPALRRENGAVIEKEQVSCSSVKMRARWLTRGRGQFCYRPKTTDGECIIAELEAGVFVATGHGPWVSLALSSLLSLSV